MTRRRCYYCGSSHQQWRNIGRAIYLECECGLTGVSAACRSEAEDNWNLDNKPNSEN